MTVVITSSCLRTDCSNVPVKVAERTKQQHRSVDKPVSVSNSKPADFVCLSDMIGSSVILQKVTAMSSEQTIKDLCLRAITAEGADFASAVAELHAALKTHTENLRAMAATASCPNPAERSASLATSQ